jgi:hypothetical protein
VAAAAMAAPSSRRQRVRADKGEGINELFYLPFQHSRHCRGAVVNSSNISCLHFDALVKACKSSSVPDNFLFDVRVHYGEPNYSNEKVHYQNSSVPSRTSRYLI